MPRIAQEDICWDQVNRQYTPGKKHPLVTCQHCGKQWNSDQKARTVNHLEYCSNLPEELWQRYQPVRFNNGGAAPVKERVPWGPTLSSNSRVHGNHNNAQATQQPGVSRDGVEYVTPDFATLLQSSSAARREPPASREELGMQLLQLQMQKNDLERRELEIKMRLHQMDVRERQEEVDDGY